MLQWAFGRGPLYQMGGCELKCSKVMDLGIGWADWVSQMNGIPAMWWILIVARSLASVISLVVRLCIYSLVLSVRVCAFLHPDTFWIRWDLHPAATKAFEVENLYSLRLPANFQMLEAEDWAAVYLTQRPSQYSTHIDIALLTYGYHKGALKIRHSQN